MNKQFSHEDIYLEPLIAEEIPDSPPAPQARWHPDLDPAEVNQRIAEQAFRPLAHIDYDLLRAGWRLSELSRRYQGGYERGHALPQSAVATATGAIALACAAFEACLNGELHTAHLEAKGAGNGGATILLETLIGLTPRDRLDAYAGYRGATVAWGADPFQSLNALLTVRKNLLHAEPSLVSWTAGHWPAPVLKDLPRRIGSPYPTSGPLTDLPLGWDVHVLTPAGAEWAVQTVVAVVKWIEALDPERGTA